MWRIFLEVKSKGLGLTSENYFQAPAAQATATREYGHNDKNGRRRDTATQILLELPFLVKQTDGHLASSRECQHTRKMRLRLDGIYVALRTNKQQD